MSGTTRAAWLPGWIPAAAERALATVPKALRFLPASERLEERRLATGRHFPGGLPALSVRMVEGILAAGIALLIKTVPYTTTRELGVILFSISGAALVLLGVVEFRTWRRWQQ
ncbi:MAG TPA: hypothetical protein VFU23_04735 [Gemmatimonadales bacterium]|nr:hypothetical protein [Gemmatimonadales bacterium]